MIETSSNLTGSCNRRGFTLIEMLVVVAIIAFLTSLSVVVMFGITDQANEEATVTTIRKISRLIDQRQEAFDRAFPGVQTTWANNFQSYFAAKVAAAESIPQPRALALIKAYAQDNPVWNILARKVLFRLEFPQRVSDMLPGGSGGFNDTDNNGIPDTFQLKIVTPLALKNLLDAGNATPTGPEISMEVSRLWTIHTDHEIAAVSSDTVHSTESSELLYFFLMHSGTYGASTAGENSFASSEIADTDGDGFLEFVDAWGNPLRFYRWPTRLIDPSLPATAFDATGGPNIAVQNDPTDLQMTIAVDNDHDPSIHVVGTRTVSDDERSVADFLMKGLPRRLEFSEAYLDSQAARLDNPAKPGEVFVLIPPDHLLRDPDDPAGLLYGLLENGLNLGVGTVSIAHEFNETNYHTPDTFHTPLVVSAGLDELLGLYEPNDVANLGHLAMYDLDLDGNGTSGQATDFQKMIEQVSDNLTNRNRRVGGR